MYSKNGRVHVPAYRGLNDGPTPLHCAYLRALSKKGKRKSKRNVGWSFEVETKLKEIDNNICELHKYVNKVDKHANVESGS